MNVKKFAQDKAKKMKYEKFLKSNKQNLYSVDDSKFKQFSVDLHKLSMDQDYHNKNIIKEEISIFLENQSQNKTFNDKNALQVELKKFTKKLDEDVGSVREFLDAQLEDGDDIRAQEIRKLIGVLLKKLQRDTSRYGSVCGSSSASQSRQKYSSKTNVLNETMITPYLKDEVSTLQRKLAYLEQQSKQYRQFQQIQKSQKQYIKHTLMTVYNQQMEQVSELEQFGDVIAFC